MHISLHLLQRAFIVVLSCREPGFKCAAWTKMSCNHHVSNKRKTELRAFWWFTRLNFCALFACDITSHFLCFPYFITKQCTTLTLAGITFIYLQRKKKKMFRTAFKSDFWIHLIYMVKIFMRSFTGIFLPGALWRFCRLETCLFKINK